MTSQRDDSLDRETAYSIETPDDSRRLYAKWAISYDETFVAETGYVYHENVVGAFLDAGGSAGGAILDVGCGTGIVGQALGDVGEKVIDGIDISPEMIAVAREKRTVFDEIAYRELFIADLTQPLDIADDVYTGIVSAGTFTHGHLRPDPIRELVRVAAPTAVCAIGINAEHYATQGFDALFAELSEAGKISSPALIDVAMFDRAPEGHGGDRANIAVFQVLA